MIRSVATSVVLAMLLGTAVPALGQNAAAYEQLEKVKSKKFDQVFLLPDTDFRAYGKIMIDPPEVAFQKNWLKDFNRDQVSLSSRLSDQDAARILNEVRDGLDKVYADAFAKAGYQIVDTPGADVLRVRTAVVNLVINAPETHSAGRSRTFAPEAGRARLILEARDSLSGAVLGVAVDDQYVGDTMTYMRNSVTNRSDFKQAFEHWAKISVDGLDNLKSLSPVGSGGQAAR